MALLMSLGLSAQPCNLGYYFTSSPSPTSGTYSSGTAVQFCYVMDTWNIDATDNWFQGISISFGPGWDLATLTPGAPPATLGPNGGSWGWFNSCTGTSPTAIGTVGPGFFFDLDQDGDPGNNLGDEQLGGQWIFCWTITTNSGVNCVDGADLSVTVNSYSDSQIGSWDTPGCFGDPVASQPATLVCCTPNYAGVDGSVTLCSTDAPVDLMTYITGGPDLGGTWLDPFAFPTTSTFDPALSTPGDYIYSAPQPAGCPTDQAIVSVTVDIAPYAGPDGTATFCSNGVAEDLMNYLGGAVAGGTWTDVNGDPFSGVYDPASMTPGAFTYSITGQGACTGAEQATVTTAEVAAPDAGTASPLTVCDNGAAVSLANSLGGTPQAGTWSGPLGASNGTFTPGTDPAGDYVYTVTGNPPCIDAQSIVTVTVNAAPPNGNTAAASYCSSDPAVDLYTTYFSSLPNTGTWTGPGGTAMNGTLQPTTATTGDYTYTIAGIAPCTDGANTVTITINPAPDAGLNGVSTLCSSAGQQPFTGLLLGTPDANGTWTDPNNAPYPNTLDPSTAISGTYTYTVPPSAFCAGASATVQLTIVQASDAGTDASLTVCENDPNVNLFTLLGGTPQNTGSWESPGGTPMNGIIDPSFAASGDYVYTVTANAPCPSATGTVSVTVDHLPAPGTDNSVAVCADSTDQDMFALLGAASPGGFWTAPDGSMHSGTFQPATDASGDYTYHVLGTGSCTGDTLTSVISATAWVLPSPVFTLDTVSGCTPVVINFQLIDQNVIEAHWQFGDGAIDNGVPSTQYTYEDPGAYDVSVSVTDPHGCNVDTTVTAAVTVYPLPDPHFTATPNPTVTMMTDIAFEPAVHGYPSYSWISNGTEIGTADTFAYHFPTLEADYYQVCLHVVDTNRCENEYCDPVIVQQELTVNVPNAFTPDGNGLNDKFVPVLLGMWDKDYEFTIFDRWGEVVFDSLEPGEAWNGGMNNGGSPLPTGVYTWHLHLREAISAQRKDIYGHVSLLK